MSTVKKATWLHKLPATPEAVKTVLRRLADAGFDLLIPCIKQVSGIADYHSKVARVREEYRDWDPLAVLAEEAGRVGLGVHAWCCVFVEGDESNLLAAHPEFETVKGEEMKNVEGHRWACAMRPEVRDYEFALYQELIDNYPLRGVHLDYIRFGCGLCFCDYCKAEYAKATGGDLSALGFFEWNRADARGMDAWLTWRAAPITEFVRRVREASSKAGMELSAAVFNAYPETVVQVGQDWVGWVREGLLDMVIPMNYSVSTAVASGWARNHAGALAGVSGGCEHWEGLLRPASMTSERFAGHVRAVTAAGGSGFSIFEYNYLTDDDLAALSRM